MTVLHEVVEVSRSVEEVFAYISDFTTTEEWDSTARSARKLSPGAIAQGTQFEVVCALPVGSVTLLYTLERLDENALIVLNGRCAFFEVRDTITLTSTATGTLIDYRAEFQFKPLISGIAALSSKGLQSMGRESVAGLAAALEDNYSLQKTSRFTRVADRLVLPGVTMFSRLGYTRGRKHFNPMSASVKSKHMLITGASSGLGYAAALELAGRGAQLTLVMRNQQKAEDTVADIQRETGNSEIRYEIADLSLMSDVDALVARMKQRGQPLDVLINNAGALFNSRAETDEGFEQSFALLLLSPYRLTEGLKPLLAKAASPRVVNVVSGGMYSQKLEVEALQMPDTSDYSGSVAYARQKRALMVLTQEWAKEWAEAGIAVNAMHPGWADTPGVREALPQFRKLTRRVLRSAAEGADTIVWLAVATEADEATGELFLDREVRPVHLLGSTREEPRERAQLMTLLQGLSSRLDKAPR
ncbi:3-beta-hydroxycholanate 3-dehydrogenase (NADP(+)) [Halioglobus japonicus]|nr:3-beta-hydroxycholanate 3-dehydrogenase (NADP(+)) [Halioglobus japonicus]